MGAITEPLTPFTTTRADGAAVQIQLCVPDDQERFLPPHCCTPLYLPAHAPLPRHGEVIYLGHGSTWGVAMVVHQVPSPHQVRVEVWLEHLPPEQLMQTAGFAPTQ